MGKDPNAPRRPLSGYMAFGNSMRAQVEKETGLSGIKTAKVLGQRWQKLNDKEKAKWNDPAKKEMEKFKKRWASYRGTANYKKFKVAQEEARLKKWKREKRNAPKDKHKPKAPLSGYLRFADDVRNKVHRSLGTKSIRLVSKEISAQWKKLSEAKRNKYEVPAKKEREKYAKKMEAYKKTNHYKAHQKVLQKFREEMMQKAPMSVKKEERKKVRDAKAKKKAIESKRKKAKKEKEAKAIKKKRAKATAAKKAAAKKKAAAAKKKAAAKKAKAKSKQKAKAKKAGTKKKKKTRRKVSKKRKVKRKTAAK